MKKHRPENDQGMGVGRPRVKPAMRDMTNNTMATKKMIFAISIDNPAIAPKPRTPAINAMIKNVIAHPNMIKPSNARNDCSPNFKIVTI